MAIVTERDDIARILETSHTIAVVGLSDRPDRDSYRVAQYMMSQGYRIIPVNPMVTSALGLPCVADLDAIDAPVDIVNIFRRPEFVPAIVESAIRIHAKTVWMQVGIVHDSAAEHASSAGLNVVMDRCIMVEHRFR